LHEKYPIQLLSVRVILGDRYRLLFFLGLYGFLSLLYVVIGGKVGHAAPIGGAAIGTLPSLLYGNPARMPLHSIADRQIAEDYLDRMRYAREGDTWKPRLRRMFYFDSQITCLAADVITGPYLTLRNIRARIRRSY
jgi:hypothetical protein